MGNKLFIIGIVPVGATVSDWSANQESGISWDLVSEYVVFEDLDSYTKAVNISEESQNNNSDKDD